MSISLWAGAVWRQGVRDSNYTGGLAAQDGLAWNQAAACMAGPDERGELLQ